MKPNKIKLLVSTLLILVPYTVLFLLWDMLASDTVFKWMRSIVLLPAGIIFLCLHLACVLISCYTNRHNDQHSVIMRMTYWIIPFLALYVLLLNVFILYGNTIDVKTISLLIFGVFMLVMGNYMPKCKQNSTIGFKTHWALANEENWNATHRMGGRAMVAAGVLTLIASLLPLIPSLIAFLAAILGFTLFTVLYSYFFYKKQLADGRASKADFSPKSKKANVAHIALIAVILIGVGIFVNVGSVNVALGEESFTVSATLASPLTVSYDDIDSISYHAEGIGGTRLFGFASLRLLHGTFTNDELGQYTRYSYAGGSALLLKIGDETLVLGLENDAATEELYHALIEKMK